MQEEMRRELGKPQRLLVKGTWYTYSCEMLRPGIWWEETTAIRWTSTCRWGVLSGIVLRDGESPLHGEGPDGSTQLAKETRTGQSRTGAIRANLTAGNSNKAKAVQSPPFSGSLPMSECPDYLMDCWQDLNKDAASGVDKVTAEATRKTLTPTSGIGKATENETVPRQTGAAMLHTQGKWQTEAAGNTGA